MLGVAFAYLAVLAYFIITVDRPTTIIVSPESAEVTMNGIEKVSFSVQILNNKDKPMSGQKISFKQISGSGKVIAIRSVTLDDGIGLGEYTAGYGTEEQTAEVLIENETGLQKSIFISEKPNQFVQDKIIIEADTENAEILKSGLKIEATLLDDNGNPMPQQKLVFKLVEGTGGFTGFRMMNKVTNADGIAKITFRPENPGKVVIAVESENNSSVSQTIEFSVK